MLLPNLLYVYTKLQIYISKHVEKSLENLKKPIWIYIYICKNNVQNSENEIF